MGVDRLTRSNHWLQLFVVKHRCLHVVHLHSCHGLNPKWMWMISWVDEIQGNQESNQMDILGTTLEKSSSLFQGSICLWNMEILVPSVMGRMLLRRFFGHDDVATLLLFLLDSSERIWSETQSIFGLRTNLEPTLSPSKNTDRFGRVLLNAFGVAELKLNISQLRRVERWICCMCNHYSEVSGYADGLCDQGTVQKTRRELRKGVRRGVWGGIYHFMLIQKQTSNENNLVI